MNDLNDLLKSVKADLTDRRLLPLVALVLVGLLAAIGYAAFGGSSSSTTPTASSAPAPVVTPKGIAVSEAQPATGESISETTDGEKTQRKGSARNPFTVLPGTVKASSASSSSSSSASSKSSSSSSSGSSSKGSSSTGTETKPSKPSTPAKPKSIYMVALQFGVVPAGVTPENALLTPFTGLSKATPLPTAKERLIELVGVTVTRTGVSAAFAVDGEVILSGSGRCLPSATQCLVFDVKEGKSEQLQYLPPTGPIVNYELRVVSIAKRSATDAKVSSIQRAQGRIAKRLLAGDGALRLAGLRYSSQAGVLVFVSRPAFGARASSSH